MISKDQSREDSKNEYILQLTQTNKDQHEHYYTILPDVFNVSQKSDKVSWQSQTSSPWFTLFPTMITIVNPAIETPDLAPDWTTTLQLLEYVPYSLCLSQKGNLQICEQAKFGRQQPSELVKPHIQGFQCVQVAKIWG